jgi:hypothetical protein
VTQAEQQKVPVLYTAKQCLSNMSSLAVRWQPDALPFHMESDVNSEATGQDGKATIWRALFASASRGAMKAFTCSGSRLPNAPYGLTSAADTPYAPNVPGLMFVPSYLQVDSDAAYATTLKHGGDTLLKKDAKQPVFYLLDWDAKNKTLLWTVVYGKSLKERGGICLINASTGGFVRAGK